MVAELDNDKNGKGIVDKEWLAVDQSRGKRRGTLYVAWSRLDEEQQRWELLCAALPLGAKQFTASVRLGEPLDLKSGIDHVHQVQLAVRPDGTLDAVWRMSPTNQLVHASSQDGAKTFSKPMPISDADDGVQGRSPSLTATPDGNLFVAWVNKGRVCYSVFVSGRWLPPQRVADDPSEGSRLSHPAAAATRDALWMLVYRRENDPARVQVVLYRSPDRGKSWKEHRIIARREFRDGRASRFSPGDYIGLAAAKGRVYAAYILPGDNQERPAPQLYVSIVDEGQKGAKRDIQDK
ncbi:MAG TPA: sialidase family protein [Gemmataceae bacterium]